MNNNKIGVGTGVFLLNRQNQSVLMSKRKDNGLIALPGGHVERYEKFEQCGKREVFEEINVDIPEPQIFSIQNVIRKELDHHYIVIFLKSEIPENVQFKTMEPEKHHDWEWVNANQFEQFYKEEKLFYGLMQLRSLYENSGKLFEYIFQY